LRFGTMDIARDMLGYKTFGEYCKKRWDFSRIRAFQLIQSVEIRENVLTIVNIAPDTESQCRRLARLAPPVPSTEIPQGEMGFQETLCVLSHFCDIGG
jgi:hypothetical protein